MTFVSSTHALRRNGARNVTNETADVCHETMDGRNVTVSLGVSEVRHFLGLSSCRDFADVVCGGHDLLDLDAFVFQPDADR